VRVFLTACAGVLIGAVAPAFGADEDALSIADKAEMVAEKASDWRIFAEGALRESTRQGTGAALHGERLSFDVRYDKVVAPGLRAVFADRLDMNRLYGAAGDGNINTLKEAYLSWQAQPDRIADLGRINVRNGVATGYNPTDYFRTGALRSIVSLDPASLRENRLGSAMVRGQALWESGSVTGIYSPKLADRPNNGAYNLDIGATNQRDRWLVAASQKVSEQLNPQFLVSGGAGQSTQFGFNVTALVNDATVVYGEWSGGRSPSLLTQALGTADESAFRNRVATGVTYTTSDNLSLTAEYDYNGTGLDKNGWNALRRGSPLAYGRYRTFVATVQDPATRHNLFFYATWTDAMVKHLDLTAMLRYDAVDSSRLQWFEARYHWTKVDLALQAQMNLGKPASDFGALSERRITQVVLRHFF
jgi:hypothetical protein